MPAAAGRVNVIWVLFQLKTIHDPPSSINRLSKGEDIRKQHDSAKIQHGYYGSQGCLFANMSNVKMFHLMDFKGY
jgi:hypothetical protein